MLVLASTSRWRIGMLQAAGVEALGIGAPIDEYAITGPSPVGLAEARALGKARAVAAIRPGDTVIGADQVCWAEDGGRHRIFEKPTSPEEHLAHLRWLSGRWHTLTVAVALCRPGWAGRGGADPAREVVLIEHSRILMRALPEAELAAYVQSGEGSGCAGGYQAEARGAQLIERIEGDWNNVIGMPLFAVISLLRREGWRPPAG